jgi:SAM-dependent methyltransferase
MAISSVWSQGYVTDTLYTDNVFREQSPVWINYVAARHGCVPRPLDQSFSYLELGCGLGHSITVFAAAFPKGRFVGVDFNPAQIDHAQRRARALGLGNLTFVEASFQDLAADSAGQGPARGLDTLDFVTFHGIYSWISTEARAAMQKIIFDRLKPGGLVYNSYNAMPGWIAELPMQRLAAEMARLGRGDSSTRARQAFERIGDLAKTKAGYFGAMPQVAKLIPNLAKKPGNYLAHEYLNGDWNAFYATDVAAEMAHAKLDFVGSATLVENHEDLVLTEESRKQINAEPDENLRVLLRDFLVNQRFRRDVFVRGHARLGPRESRQHQAGLAMVAGRSLAGLTKNVKVPRGTVNFDVGDFDALKEIISESAGTERDFAAAFQKKGGKTQDFGRLLAILTATGSLMPAASSYRPGAFAASKNGDYPRQRLTLKANEAELRQALDQASTATFASPVSGNAAQFVLSDCLALQECLAAPVSLETLAGRVKAAMDKRGMRVADQGKVVTEPEAAIARLKVQAGTFLGETLPLLRRLGIVESA